MLEILLFVHYTGCMTEITPTMKEIARRISGRRREKGLTQKQLAQMLGKSRPYVIALERGTDAHPAVTVIYALAEIFGCGVDDLLPARLLDEERPEICGDKISAEAEDEVLGMLREARNG